MQITGQYFDGHSSQAHSVRVTFSPNGEFEILGNGITRREKMTAVSVSARIAVLPRVLSFSDGATCVLPDNHEFDIYLRRWRPLVVESVVDRFERHWSKVLAIVLLGSVIGVATIYYAVYYGIPGLARVLAERLPMSLEARLGNDALKQLDEWVFMDSELAEAQQLHAEEELLRVKSWLPESVEFRGLEFRRGELLGANALALPSGEIVLTDDLVIEASNDGELAAILAHELGHLARRHALRVVIQGSLLTAVIAATTGNQASTTALSNRLASTFMRLGYSRRLEREADDFAWEILDQAGIPPRCFADILLRLSDQESFPEFLSSHPAAEKRALRFQVGANCDSL